MVERTISKLDAARQLLERAIELYTEGDYLSALTLAGAAEEPLGKMRRRDVPSLSAVEVFADAFRHAESDLPLERAKMIKKLNEVRDWLKHYQDGSAITCDERACAEDMLTRAIINYMIAANGPTGPMRAFIERGKHEA